MAYLTPNAGRRNGERTGALLISVLIILAIIAANGYFVVQEFAYTALDRSRLAARPPKAMP